MDIYEKTIKKYKNRRLISIFVLAGGGVAFILTLGFMYLPNDLFPLPFWNQFHTWGIGVAIVLLVGGAILFAHCYYSLRNIERTVDKINPDERELAIQEKTRSKTLRFYMWAIYPVVFLTSSVLLWLKIINYYAWIIIIVNIVSLLIALALIKLREYKKW